MRTVAELREYIDSLVGYDIVTFILPAGPKNPLIIYLKADLSTLHKKYISAHLPLGSQPVYEIEPT